MPSIEAEIRIPDISDYLHIAVAVVHDHAGRILISQRKEDCAYAGQWEFPGGKVEQGESVQQALARELDEELGLRIERSRPLIRIRFEYPDRKVFLDTWQVTDWSGQAASREGQEFAWVCPDEIDEYPMLAANRPITRAAQLPDRYLITPDIRNNSIADFLDTVERSLNQGVRIMRLRQTQLSQSAYEALAEQVSHICRNSGAMLMVDIPDVARHLGVGLHLNTMQLQRCRKRPVDDGVCLAASCHTREELHHASEIGCDFAVLGSVDVTPTHSNVNPLGWENFSHLVDGASLPVFALGGMQTGDLPKAWEAGAQGIAAIRDLWTP